MIGRIEMHLVATRDIDFTIDGRASPSPRARASIPRTATNMARAARRLLLLAGGWTRFAEWTDNAGDFAVILAEAQPKRFAPVTAMRGTGSSR